MVLNLFGLQNPLFLVAESKYPPQGSKLVSTRCKLVELLFSVKAFPTKRILGLGFMWLNMLVSMVTGVTGIIRQMSLFFQKT